MRIGEDLRRERCDKSARINRHNRNKRSGQAGRCDWRPQMDLPPSHFVPHEKATDRTADFADEADEEELVLLIRVIHEIRGLSSSPIEIRAPAVVQVKEE